MTVESLAKVMHYVYSATQLLRLSMALLKPDKISIIFHNNQQIVALISELDGGKDISDINDTERRVLHFSFLADLVDSVN